MKNILFVLDHLSSRKPGNHIALDISMFKGFCKLLLKILKGSEKEKMKASCCKVDVQVVAELLLM